MVLYNVMIYFNRSQVFKLPLHKKNTAAGTGRLLAVEEGSGEIRLLICVDYFRIQLTFR
jgi:hypothetical protein